MIRGLYTAASGLWVNQFRADVLTNNLANLNTPGFRAADPEAVSFPEIMVNQTIYGSTTPGTATGFMGTGVAAAATVFDLSPGPYQNTGIPTDLAILGEGFFAVQTPQGTLYTRQGNFGVDAEGRLVTQDGYLVLGEDGPITVGSERFDVAPDGTITSNGKPVGRLLVVDPGNGATLHQIAGTMFQSTLPLQPLAGHQVRQGTLESSNVDETAAMVDLLTALRAYEASAQAIQAENETLQKATNDVGRV